MEELIDHQQRKYCCKNVYNTRELLGGKPLLNIKIKK